MNIHLQHNEWERRKVMQAKEDRLIFEPMFPNVRIPEQSKPHDMGLDLRWYDPDISIRLMQEKDIFIAKTSILIQLPLGYYGMICSRSGLAAKKGVIVLNAPGIIDPGYRGEIKCILYKVPGKKNTTEYDCYVIDRGDRIAQLIIAPIVTGLLPDPLYNITEGQVDETERGQDGLGSTGTK